MLRSIFRWRQFEISRFFEISMDRNVLRDFETPFQENGGLRLITGNIGRGVLKT